MAEERFKVKCFRCGGDHFAGLPCPPNYGPRIEFLEAQLAALQQRPNETPMLPIERTALGARKINRDG